MTEEPNFKKVILKYLKEKPCAGERFTKFMLKQFENWKGFTRADWLDLFEKILAFRACAPYDFLFFSHNALGINVYEEFFFRMKMNEEGKDYLIGCINPKGHNILSSIHFITVDDYVKIRRIRKRLEWIDIILNPIEYKKMKHGEGMEYSFIEVEYSNMEANYLKFLQI